MTKIENVKTIYDYIIEKIESNRFQTNVKKTYINNKFESAITYNKEHLKNQQASKAWIYFIYTYMAYLHFVIKNFGLAGLRAGYEVFVENAQYVRAYVAQLLLHLAAVRADHVELVLRALQTRQTRI